MTDRVPVWPLITARCKRCPLVAAKYWQSDRADQGWVTIPADIAAEADVVSLYVHERVCDCDPPPTLPQGEELAALVARAKQQRHPRVRRPSFRRPGPVAPLVIRV